MTFYLGIICGLLLGTALLGTALSVFAQFDTPGLPWDGGLELSRQLRAAELDRAVEAQQQREWDLDPCRR